MERGVKSGEAREGNDCEGGGGGSSSQRGCEERICPAAATRELKRDDRLFRHNRPQQGGEAGDSLLEGLTVAADCEVRFEEDALELRKLTVRAQGQLLTG